MCEAELWRLPHSQPSITIIYTDGVPVRICSTRSEQSLECEWDTLKKTNKHKKQGSVDIKKHPPYLITILNNILSDQNTQ